MVVDLAVVDDAEATVVARHRLLAVRDIDDAEATVPERDARLDEQPASIGTPVRKHVAQASSVTRDTERPECDDRAIPQMPHID